MSKSARRGEQRGRTQRTVTAERRPAAGAEELADRLHSAAIHLLRRVRRADPASGVPAPQLSALSVVVFQGPLTLGALAVAEQVRPPTMTRVVAALERAGLVERSRVASDRRVAVVQATARGKAVLTEGRQRRVQILTDDLAKLAGSDRDLLRAALDVLEQVVGLRDRGVVRPAR